MTDAVYMAQDVLNLTLYDLEQDNKPIPKANRSYYPTLETLEIKKLSPHCCRNTFASLCERAEITPIKIEKLIGHTDYKMTKKYTHTEIEDLREAINKR